MAKNDSLLSKYKNIISTASQKREKTRTKIGPLGLNLSIDGPDGIENGRICQIVGASSAGKSTLALNIVAHRQLDFPEESVLYLDFERSFDADYAQTCGVDLERLLVVRATTTEVGLSVLEDAIRNFNVKLAIVDSVAAAQPSSELDKTMEDSPKMASNAGLLSRWASRAIPLLDDHDALAVVINQWRSNFNSLSPIKEVPYGPKALLYASACVLSLSKIKTEDGQQVVRVAVQKNKVNVPQMTTEFVIGYGVGIREDLDLVNLAMNYGIVSKAGSWYQYRDVKLQGLDNFAHAICLDDIRSEVIEAWKRSS